MVAACGHGKLHLRVSELLHSTGRMDARHEIPYREASN